MYSDWIRQVEGKADDRVRETEEPRQRINSGNEVAPSGYVLDEYYSLEDVASRRPSGPRIGDYRNGGQVGVYSEPARSSSGWSPFELFGSNTQSEPEEAVSTASTDTVTVSGTNYRVQYRTVEDGYNLTEYIPVSGEDSNT